MQKSGEVTALPNKTTMYEESAKNYITLLDLDEQKKLRCSKETVLKAEYLINKPSSSTIPPSPAVSTFENRIRLYDLLPFPGNFTGNFTAEQLALVYPPEKRIEPIVTLNTAPCSTNNSTSQTKTHGKSVIMKEIKAFMQPNRCPICQCQDCSCIRDKIKTKHGTEDTEKNFEFSPDFPGASSLYSFNYPKVGGNNNQSICSSPANRKRKTTTKLKNESSPKSNGLKTKSSERTCTKCGLVFSSHREVLLHSRVHNTEKTKEFGCHLCGKYFSQRTTLRQHLILHSGEKNFVCTECGKRFALKIYLKTHQKSCGGGSR